MTINDRIRNELFRLQDKEYQAFESKLIPTVDPKTIIGIRTPALRKLADTYFKDPKIKDFLHALPHHYFEENQLHAFLISKFRNYDECLEETERFLPYIDNWATCDQLSPKVFARHPEELLVSIRRWLDHDHTYTVRFGIGMLMRHYLDDAFQEEYPELVAKIRSDEYYINMMIAWYFATALAKQYDTVIPYLEERKLDPWTHNKTIRKAIESYRISPEQKEYLRTLTIKEMKEK